MIRAARGVKQFHQIERSTLMAQLRCQQVQRQESSVFEQDLLRTQEACFLAAAIMQLPRMQSYCVT